MEKKDIKYTIVKDITIDDFISIRKALGWKTINYDQIKKALDNTMYKVSIIENDKVIAIGRLVGDYSCKGVLSDIIVLPEYQGFGIGKIVVTTLFEMVDKGLKSGDKFQIEATPTAGNREFYIKCGMKYKPENQDGVYLWIEK